MAVPVLSGAIGYAYKKLHTNEKDISVLKSEMSTMKETSAQRHKETLDLMKETRDDVREVRVSVSTLVSAMRADRHQ